jgi:hypothetical protein
MEFTLATIGGKRDSPPVIHYPESLIQQAVADGIQYRHRADDDVRASAPLEFSSKLGVVSAITRLRCALGIVLTGS